jgi:hypothetical protein
MARYIGSPMVPTRNINRKCADDYDYFDGYFERPSFDKFVDKSGSLMSVPSLRKHLVSPGK